MKNLLKLSLIIYCGLLFADTEDLQQMMRELDSRIVATKSPELPVYTPPKVNFKEYQMDTLFSSDRLTDDSSKQNSLQNYNLNQLQMVGYMEDKKQLYAFIKTPYEVLMVKTGDKIKSATVTKVTSSDIELDEVQTQDSKTYHKKVFLKLDTNKDNSLKLKL